MPQTLLAIGALLMVTTYTLSVNQRSVVAQRVMITREVEEMASAVALESMEIVRARAFDQAVLDGRTEGRRDDLDEFAFETAAEHFRTGRACEVFDTGTDVCDDLDDFNDMVTATRSVPMGGESVAFTVDVEVEYVDEAAFVRYDGRTFFKRVTVLVQDDWGGALEPYLAEPIELTRVFSYDFATPQ